MYVYIIECRDGSLYTGIASDITHRLTEHYFRLPACAKYTRSHPMKRLCGLWLCADKSTAYKLEFRIKQLPRKAKLELLAAPDTLAARFGALLNCTTVHPVPAAEQAALNSKLLLSEQMGACTHG